jgi:prepilin-type N-terminal cleavage/methylation domain-containing protein
MKNVSRMSAPRCGFTLIELSIVLVIIGLIVGGILVGQNLINAASVRAQITQIEKYNRAANTFYGKYGYLPGDIPAGVATQFGFAARGNIPGQGNGDGVLQGLCQYGWSEAGGETAMFWVDLSTARLIDDSLSTATATGAPASNVTGSGVANYMPNAKMNSALYVYVWDTVNNLPATMANNYPGPYFGISAVTTVENSCGKIISNNIIPVMQAYNLDAKIDDGLPLSGNVLALGVNNDPTSV